MPARIFEYLNNYWASMSDSEKQNAQLLITGQSMGGGLAQFIGAYSKSKTFHADRSWAKSNKPFLEFLKASKVYTFASPQVFVVNRSQDDVDVDWSGTLAKTSYHFIQASDSLRVHQNAVWRAVSYPFFLLTPLVGKLWWNPPWAMWNWFANFKEKGTRLLLIVKFRNVLLKITAGWYLFTFIIFAIYHFGTSAEMVGKTETEIAYAQLGGLGVFALLVAFWNSINLRKRHREYGAIYYSPTTEQGYTKKDEAFVSTRTDAFYKFWKFPSNRNPKSLETMVEVHLSNLALKSYDTVTDFGGGDPGQLGAHTDAKCGQRHDPSQSAAEAVSGNDSKPRVIINNVIMPDASGFIQYSVFTACISLVFILL